MAPSGLVMAASQDVRIQTIWWAGEPVQPVGRRAMTRAAASTRQAGEHTAVVAGVAVDTRHWIGGQRVASPATFADISPIDETEIAQVASGQAGDASAAVAAAV